MTARAQATPKTSCKPLDPRKATPVNPADFDTTVQGKFLWYDGADLTLEGCAWPRECTRYTRLPSRVEGKIHPEPWDRSRQSAGLSLRFESDAEFFLVRYFAPDGTVYEGQTFINQPALYVRHQGRWQFLGITYPCGNNGVNRMTHGAIAPGHREYCMYLPIGRRVGKVEIGIPAKAKIIPSAPRRERPIVVYGTSICHGGNAGRPGTNHVQLIERHFDYPVINLGFSGCARMEPEVFDLVSDIDARIFILDCLPNVVAQEVRERFAPGIKKLRKAHPHTPIVCVDNIHYQDGFLVPERHQRFLTSNAAQQEAFHKLVADGMQGLHYVYWHELFTDAIEATNDATHPNDIGFRLMADALIKALTPLMAATKP